MMQERKKRLREILKEKGLDIILVYSDSHRTSFGMALNRITPILFHYYYITKDTEGFLEVDYLIEELKLKTKLDIFGIQEQTPEKDIAKFVNTNYPNIGIIGDAPWTHLKQVTSKIYDVNKEAQGLLLVKDDYETDKVKASAKAVSQIMDNLDSSKWIGKTQIEIKEEVRKKFSKESEGLSFPICITSSSEIKNTTASLPSCQKIQTRDIIAIDAGVIKDGFYSDCTRMYFLNNPEAEENYSKLLRAHIKVIERIKPGLYLKEIISLYKKELEKENLPAETLEVQDLGHSIGFYVHENPIFYLPEHEEVKLVDGMIITLEPEIVLDGYRLRVEDMILVKNKVEVLTK